MAIAEQPLVAHERQILDLRLGMEHQVGLIVVGKAESNPIDTRSDLLVEIADVLGIRETNVATKISRLKQRLRSELARRHDDED